MVKAFAFWPQLAMGQPSLTTAQQAQVVGDAVDMFLGFYTAPEAPTGTPAPPTQPAARTSTRRTQRNRTPNTR
ncbi:hypothetical protein D3C71_2128180 [compost metagenome]